MLANALKSTLSPFSLPVPFLAPGFDRRVKFVGSHRFPSHRGTLPANAPLTCRGICPVDFKLHDATAPVRCSDWLSAGRYALNCAIFEHVVPRAIAPHSPAKRVVVPCNELLPMWPLLEAIVMHARIGVAPKRIVRIGNEMLRRNEPLALREDSPAKGTLGFASDDDRHG